MLLCLFTFKSTIHDENYSNHVSVFVIFLLSNRYQEVTFILWIHIIQKGKSIRVKLWLLLSSSESRPYLQGVPKKMSIKPNFNFQNLGGVSLGVKNNCKNFGNKKNSRLFSKILSKLTFSIRKMPKILCFYKFMVILKTENFFKCHKSQYPWICIYD